MTENRHKRQHTDSHDNADLPPPSHRVLAIPELLSLIFGFLAHTDVSPGEESDILSIFTPTCSCSCSQCFREDPQGLFGATGVISIPSPFSIPEVQPPNRRSRTRKDDESDDEDLSSCHCRIPSHRQLSSLFGRSLPKRTRPTPNRPSFNLSNALVCKAWSSVALDVLWRVVDTPERLFALLDGSWGTVLDAQQTRLKGLGGLCVHEKGSGRMPQSWEPGVQAFLNLEDDEDEDEDEDWDGENSEKDTKPKSVRRQEYEIFSFRSPPTPTSWARFDRYARRVRHLVYTRPCLSQTAMSQIAVTRPRLSVLPRMHTLSWADNPINHAVLFMHEGVKRLELRIEVFGREKVNPRVPAEQTFNLYSELGLNDFVYDDRPQTMGQLYGLGTAEDASGDIKPNRSISRTLASNLAEIPRRMPNLHTLCISSYIPVSLYLPALLCTLLRIPTSDEEDATPTLRNLRRLVIPRYYTCAPVIERLAQLPHLETLEFQFDDALGWGRASDVGLKKCVPPEWRVYGPEFDPVSDDSGPPPQSKVFSKIYDINLTIPFTEARNLLLASPPRSAAEDDAPPPMLNSTSLASSGPPCWPQNLVYLYLDAPPGLLASPFEIGALIQTIALACYGPSTGRDKTSARLQRLGLVCSADPDSSYEAICGSYDPTVPDMGNDKYLTRGTFEPLLALLDGEDSEESDMDAPWRLRPKFALKSFEISHHYPLALSHSDVEHIAERWGGCIEVLVLNCEPIAGFGMTVEGGLSVDSVNRASRLEATLTLAALLPFARHCGELRHLGLFVDASRGVKGLMKEVLDPSSTSTKAAREAAASHEEGGNVTLDAPPRDIEDYTAAMARRYLQAPLSHPSIPNAFPVFRKLEKLSFGISVMAVTLADTKIQFTPEGGARHGLEDGEEDNDEGLSINRKQLIGALRDAARARIQGAQVLEDLANANDSAEDNDHTDLMNYIRRQGVRMGLVEEDEIESELLGVQLEDSTDLVPLFLAQILPCYPTGASDSASSAFTTVIEAGTTWSGSPSGLMSSSRAIQANWTVGEPYEVEEEKQRRRRRRNLQLAQEQAQEEDDDQPQSQPLSQSQQTQSQSQSQETDGDGAGGSSQDAAGTATATAANAGTISTLVVPFVPLPPSFAEPSTLGYLPELLLALFRARIKKWVTLNETVLPMAVAMREAGWVWGSRVANELGTRRSQVDELQVRVAVMNGLMKARGGAPSKTLKEVEGPDGCVVC